MCAFSSLYACLPCALMKPQQVKEDASEVSAIFFAKRCSQRVAATRYMFCLCARHIFFSMPPPPDARRRRDAFFFATPFSCEHAPFPFLCLLYFLRLSVLLSSTCCFLSSFCRQVPPAHGATIILFMSPPSCRIGNESRR